MKRRGFLTLAFRAAATVACLGVARLSLGEVDDGIELFSISHPGIAGEDIWSGDNLTIENGLLVLMRGWDNPLYGVAISTAKAGQPVHAYIG